jgi:hypothetical protein
MKAVCFLLAAVLVGCLIGFFFKKGLSFFDKVILVVIMFGVLLALLIFEILTSWS